MMIRLFNNRLGDLSHQRNLLLALVASLLLLNSLQALYILFHEKRVILVPPDLKQEVWLEKHTVSASYLEEMALVFSTFILESSPESAAYKREIILRYAASDGYGALKRQLLSDEERLKKDHVVTSFQANSLKVDPSHLTVDLTGDFLRFVGEKRISQSRDTYRFQFTYKAGRLLIKSFKLITSDREEE